MQPRAAHRVRLVPLIAGLVLALTLVAVGRGRADSTPVGPLPAGPRATITTSPGLLVAVALPRPSAASGLVWRIARAFDARVIRQLSEADVGTSVVLVFKVAGRGDTSLVFALTRGDVSAKAVKSSTSVVHSV
jgi:hypothetical protein